MKNKIFCCIGILLWILLAVLPLHSILSGAIPFWYDPARDMLEAVKNLHKLTFIGSTSGIPGIFYGPYWIWLLSVPLLFSKDPRLTSFFAAFIPYMILFPLVLCKFKKYFSKETAFILWVLFILGFKSYAVFIWNPNISLLLFLISIYFVLSLTNQKKASRNSMRIFIAGIAAGLALNVNMSFGSAFLLGIILFFVLNSILLSVGSLKTKFKKICLQIGCFLSGTILTFLPFLIFEIKHGFMQLKTVTEALCSRGGLVIISGMSKREIVESFFARWAQLLQVPFDLGIFSLAFLIIVLTLLIIKKRVKFSISEKTLALLILSISVSCLALYLSVQNPIWDYHFIGVEIVWILLLGILLTKISFTKLIAYCWVLFLIIIGIVSFFNTKNDSLLITNSLVLKEKVTRVIVEDAGVKNYSVYAYNPSIYSYDYSYLFYWLGNKDVPYDPGLINRQGDVYLILPTQEKAIVEDFINYRTSPELYETTGSWNMPDKTLILKRSLL